MILIVRYKSKPFNSTIYGEVTWVEQLSGFLNVSFSAGECPELSCTLFINLNEVIYYEVKNT